MREWSQPAGHGKEYPTRGSWTKRRSLSRDAQYCWKHSIQMTCALEHGKTRTGSLEWKENHKENWRSINEQLLLYNNEEYNNTRRPSRPDSRLDSNLIWSVQEGRQNRFHLQTGGRHIWNKTRPKRYRNRPFDTCRWLFPAAKHPPNSRDLCQRWRRRFCSGYTGRAVCRSATTGTVESSRRKSGLSFFCTRLNCKLMIEPKMNPELYSKGISPVCGHLPSDSRRACFSCSVSCRSNSVSHMGLFSKMLSRRSCLTTTCRSNEHNCIFFK